jgi:C4-dicarboxylate transporter DctQ subunit
METFEDTKPLDKNNACYTKTTAMIARVLEFTIGSLFLFSLCVAAYEVFMRYVMKSPHDWGDELALNAMLYSVFLGACLALREGKMTNVDMLPLMLKPKPRAILELCMSVLTTVTCAVYAWSGLLMVQRFFERGSNSSSSLETPVWLIYAVLPVGMALCTLVGVESIFKLLSQLSKRENP